MTSPAPEPSNARPFIDLRDTGLLWLINAAVFHPRGFALALITDDAGAIVGWDLLGDGSEPWRFDQNVDHRFTAAEALLARRRRTNHLGP